MKNTKSINLHKITDIIEKSYSLYYDGEDVNWKNVCDDLKTEIIHTFEGTEEITALQDSMMEEGKIINLSSYVPGTIQHRRHYKSEFERIKKLTEFAKGKRADELYHELDGVSMILEGYLP